MGDSEQQLLHCANFNKIHNQLDRHEERLDDLEKTQIKTTTLLEQFVETTKELSGTMKSISNTMVEVQNNLSNNNNEIREINNKLTKLNDKVDIESEKSKLDLRDIGKDGLKSIISYILKALLIAGASYGLFDITKDNIDKIFK